MVIHRKFCRRVVCKGKADVVIVNGADPLLTTGNMVDAHAIIGVFSSIIESHRIYS